MSELKPAPLALSRLLAFAVLPAALLVLSAWEATAHGPYWERGRYDPEYQYLLNGLKILDGLAPDHIDHPGTTLQLMIASVLKVHQLVSGPQAASALREAVLLDPESYLHSIRGTLSALMAAVLFLTAEHFHRRTRHFWAAIAFQLLIFLSPDLIHAFARVSPEPVLIITLLLATPILTEIVAREHDAPPWWQAFILGSILGALLVTKINALPLLLLGLWVPRWRDRVVLAAGILSSLLLLTIPVWRHAARIVEWIAGLTLKQGLYGSAGGGFLPAPDVLGANAVSLASQEPIYLVAMTVLVILGGMLAQDRSVETLRHRLRVNTSVAVLFFGFLMAAKYGVSRYLVPELALLGPLLLLESSTWRDVVHTPAQRRGWSWGLAALVLTLGVLGLLRLAADSQQEIRLHRSTLSLDARLSLQYPTCTIVPFYGASDQNYGLLLANEYAGGHFKEVLTRLHPGVLGYHVWGARFEDFLDVRNHEEIRSRLDGGECILLRGKHAFDFPDSEHYNPRLTLERLVVGDAEIVYRLMHVNP
jgi:hypothetical protein